MGEQYAIYTITITGTRGTQTHFASSRSDADRAAVLGIQSYGAGVTGALVFNRFTGADDDSYRVNGDAIVRTYLEEDIAYGVARDSEVISGYMIDTVAPVPYLKSDSAVSTTGTMPSADTLAGMVGHGLMRTPAYPYAQYARKAL